MDILSFKFIIFFTVLFVIYYLFPKRYRWSVLLLGSYLFYLMGHWTYVFLMLFTTLTTFVAAKYIHRINIECREKAKQIESREEKKHYKARQGARKKRIVALTLIINFGILFFFKTSVYFMPVSLIFPLGISFYTFQTSGYIIDVYREKYEPEKNFFKYALFVSYFPQIIQGPIQRYDEFVPKLFSAHSIKWHNIKYGIWLFLWGLFKKIVISNRAAIFVNTVLGGELSTTPGTSIWIAMFLFNLELYGDFSGGIDMVNGVSTMLGIELADNFKRPFFSKTLGEYWRRWHITLGTWIKDYVFYPLAMSKPFTNMGKAVKKRIGIHMGKTLPASIVFVITFVMVGLWHNVSWFYVLYGIWHGVILGLSNICTPFLNNISEKLNIRTKCMSFRWFQRSRTFLLITIGECFSLATSWQMLKSMAARMILHNHLADLTMLNTYGLVDKEIGVLIVAIAFLICISMKQEKCVIIREALDQQNSCFQVIATVLFIMVLLVFGIYGPGYNATAFIYEGF